MEKIQESVVSYFEENKKMLFFSLVVTFVWGMAAHGYVFLDNNFSHDSLVEFHAGLCSNDAKMECGRYLTWIYRVLFRGILTLPWLTGWHSLVWISLSVFLVLRLLSVQSKLVAILISGVMTVNLTVSATAATYMHDLDSYMFALLCAVGAAALWRRKHTLLGALLLTVSLGIYQSFLFVTMTFVLILSILDLMNGESKDTVITRLLFAAAMVLIGGVLYWIGLKISLIWSDIPLKSGDANSLDNLLLLSPKTILEVIPGTYQDWYKKVTNEHMSIPGVIVQAIFWMLCLICLEVYLIWIHDKKVGWKEKVLNTCLFALLPLCMNMIYVLTFGSVHYLMQYSVWLFFILPLVMIEWLLGRYAVRQEKIPSMIKCQRDIAFVLVAILIYGNVRFANGMYLKTDIEHDAHLAMMSRVVARMESDEKYIPEETEVVFVGLPQGSPALNSVTPGFEEHAGVVGLWSSDLIRVADPIRYEMYFYYVLGIPMRLAEESVWYDILEKPETKAMNPYPAQDCMRYEGDVLVVKLG